MKKIDDEMKEFYHNNKSKWESLKSQTPTEVIDVAGEVQRLKDLLENIREISNQPEVIWLANQLHSPAQNKFIPTNPPKQVEREINVSKVKLEETKNQRRLHIGSFFIDLNESDYQELIKIFSQQPNQSEAVDLEGVARIYSAKYYPTRIKHRDYLTKIIHEAIQAAIEQDRKSRINLPEATEQTAIDYYNKNGIGINVIENFLDAWNECIAETKRINGVE